MTHIPGEPLVLASRGGRLLGAAAGGLAVLSYVFSVIGSPEQWFALLGGHALVVALAWAVGWQPAVIVEDDAVTLRNIVRSHRIPLAAIQEVNTRFGLAIVADGQRYGAWAAPAPGTLHTMRLDVSRVDRLPESSYEEGTVRPGDDPVTASGVAALHVRRGVERHAVQGSGNGSRTVTTEWHIRTIAAVLISAALLALAIYS